MKKRSEVGSLREQTARVVKHGASQAAWRGPKGARPVPRGRARALAAHAVCLANCRAPVGSTHGVFVSIGDRSSLFMNNPG